MKYIGFAPLWFLFVATSGYIGGAFTTIAKNDRRRKE